MLPSERKLSEMLGVSRGTIRDAVSRMCAQKRLYTVHGKGSFLSMPKYWMNMKDFISFSASAQAAGLIPSSRLISLNIQKAGQSVAKRLRVSDKEEVYVLIRVRSFNGEPIALEKAYLPVRFCPGLEEYDFERNSLYAVLQQIYKINLIKQDANIRLTRASQEEARLLSIYEGDVVFLERAIASTAQGELVEYSQGIINAQRAGYETEIRGG